ncbi:tubulin glycylase 3A-like isoform X1 [Spodoptera litura]|uniref:Tubulin glycylase 3A-like isoform X1 n=1 Tax=Spodoptera litura TaxID=69820 RepID=A0A9J7DST2_SPOLT|nr:tubulin glycylase 3A-like isoform X1 [Spodoptera litura]
MPCRKKKTLKRRKKLLGIGTKNQRDLKLKNGRKSCKHRPSPIFKKCPHQRSNIVDKGNVIKNKSPVKCVVDNTKMEGKKIKFMDHRSIYYHEGLTPKDKNYIICNCQTKSSRYMSLKCLAARAIRENKIFSIFGSCNAIRMALVERGWVEKLPATKMNLTKIKNGTLTTKHEIHGELERLLLSNAVEKYPSNFIWRTRDDLRDNVIDMNKECPTIINKLKTDAQWTSKQGLCSSMKRNYWFYIEDFAEVIGPRSYNTGDPGEIEGFVKDYKITACTSLLKWILSMVANERPIFVDTGKISLNVVLFALSRCKDYLYKKEHKDIDRSISNVSMGQWNTFLKKYYRIIARDDVFQADTDNKLPLYMAYAKFLLKEMHKYRPQLSCEGCHNIWIIKPAHNSRGRGIRMASRLTVITDLLNKANAKYVIQKYIEEPLLIHETKFDIRQYCLVTSTYPLVIWMYKDCYLKFSSQKYNLKNYHESIHLTNNAVQRKYINCEGRHKELPTANMWDSDMYKDYLKRLDKGKVWEKIIYPGMKKSIIGIMLSCQDSLSVCKNRFELYGCDFILDKEYKPWLIEINSSPDLNHTTPVTAKICPAVLTDLIKVVIDFARDPTSSTGRFECIYRQPMTIPKYGGALDLFVRGVSLPNDYFYKGSIDLRESYDCDEDMDKVNNIKAILDKIKNKYDTVMVEPEDDSNTTMKKEKETTTRRRSRSEDELNVAASVITGQLEELLDRIVSTHSFKKKQSGHQMRSFSTPVECYVAHQPVKSVNKIMKMSLSRVEPVKPVDVTSDRTFGFSELDDGPIGKGSYVGVDSYKTNFNDISELEVVKLLSKSRSKESITSPSASTEIMLEATTKLINFINKKEKEYFTESNPQT